MKKIRSIEEAQKLAEEVFPAFTQVLNYWNVISQQIFLAVCRELLANTESFSVEDLTKVIQCKSFVLDAVQKHCSNLLKYLEESNLNLFIQWITRKLQEKEVNSNE